MNVAAVEWQGNDSRRAWQGAEPRNSRRHKAVEEGPEDVVEIHGEVPEPKDVETEESGEPDT